MRRVSLTGFLRGVVNPVRFIDAFVDGLDLTGAGFLRVEAKATGRQCYAPRRRNRKRGRRVRLVFSRPHKGHAGAASLGPQAKTFVDRRYSCKNIALATVSGDEISAVSLRFRRDRMAFG